MNLIDPKIPFNSYQRDQCAIGLGLPHVIMSYISMEPDCNTPHNNSFQGQDSENDPDSPEVFSMTQRAREHGIDVTWGDSPTRQKNKKTVQKHKDKGNNKDTPKSTLVRRKSLVIDRPKQLFKPSIRQTPPKTGIYKFMAGVRSLFPEGGSGWPPRLPPKTSTPRTATSIGDCNNDVHAEIDVNVENLLFETASDPVSWG